MTPQKLVIASRKSKLAMWQAEHVRDLLLATYPDCDVSILGMTTEGDRILDRPLAEIGGKGLFIKELEYALHDGRADLAVHSLKDVPMTLPDGFLLPAILPRDDPRDAFVSVNFDRLDALPEGARLGTSSLRRSAQLLARFPDLNIVALRGNVITRLSKLDAGEYDAIVLASAGLRRLGLADRITAHIDGDISLPAVGQGALGIEISASRGDLVDVLQPLVDATTTLHVTAERGLSRRLAGSCRVPLAGFCETTSPGQASLRARVAAPDGSEVLHTEISGPLTNAHEADTLGELAAAELLRQGAARWLQLP